MDGPDANAQLLCDKAPGELRSPKLANLASIHDNTSPAEPLAQYPCCGVACSCQAGSRAASGSFGMLP